jgi:ABC-type Zn uptake system ZnuABC Zn-binding protein ZnuA
MDLMNKTFKSIIVLFLFSLFFSINVIAEEETINIVCTNSILADFTSNIITENVTITYIMPGGACPSHFDINPGQVSEIIDADIIISLGWESWLTNISDKLVSIDQNQVKCLGLGEWSLPSNAIKFVEKIRDELGVILLEQNQTIQINAHNYINEINEKSNNLKNMITNLDYQQRKVIVMKWQKDFVEWLGFDIVASYAPPEGLSAQDKINIANAAKTEGLCAIIDNLQSGTEFGELIAADTSLSHVVFTNFPGGFEDVDTYLEMIKYNTGELVKAITIYDYNLYKQEDVNQIPNLELQRNTSIFIAIIGVILSLILLILYKRK